MSAATDERLDLLDALVYGDAFDCAVTLDELWRYSRVRVGREALRRLLSEDSVLHSVIVERDGLFCLAGRSELLERRPSRTERGRLLEHRASRVVRVLRHAPFVRGLALTGSAAARDAGEEADLDLLVIVAPERLGTAFILLGTASRLLGRRLFCPNYYVSADDVAFPPGSVYIARELGQARMLAGDPEVLRAANGWLLDVFPNLGVAGRRASPRAGLPSQRFLESLLGDRLESWGRRVAAARLRAHFGAVGEDVPADVAESFRAGAALRFHRGGAAERTLARYAACRAEVGARLEQLDRERVDSSSTA
jgi:predicted nucleotidyltransferase